MRRVEKGDVSQETGSRKAIVQPKGLSREILLSKGAGRSERTAGS